MQTSTAPCGNCSVSVDEQSNLYFAITTTQYSQRFVRSLIDEMRAELLKAGSGGEKGVNSRLLAGLAAKYNTPSNFDKVAQAQLKVGEVALKIQDELRKVAGEQEKFAVCSRGNKR